MLNEGETHLAVTPLAPASPGRLPLTSGVPSLAPVVSGVCKFKRHLLRIRPALGPRCGLRLHPGGRSLLLTLRWPAAGQCAPRAGRGLGHLWSPLRGRCSWPELPRIPALQPRAARAVRGAGEYTRWGLGPSTGTHPAWGQQRQPGLNSSVTSPGKIWEGRTTPGKGNS